MIKAIIFDFDGVIVESAHIKTEAFREVFSRWPEITDKAVEYHLKNTGVTRFKKFKYVYEELLNKSYTDKIGKDLSDDFSRICFEKIKAAPLVNGVKEFLEGNFQKYKLFIASATPDDELRETVIIKGLEKYLLEVSGYPKLKEDTVRDLIRKYKYSFQEVVYVGDGDSDRIAAQENQVHFILRSTDENQYLIEKVKHVIPDLSMLEDKLLLLNNKVKLS